MLPSATLISSSRPFLHRDAERKRQGIRGVPEDLGDGQRRVRGRSSSNSRPEGSTPAFTSVSRTAQRLARSASCLSKVVGLTTSWNTSTSLGFRAGCAPAQRGVRRAARQAAAQVAPGVERQRVQVGEQLDLVRRLEHRGAGGERVAQVLAVRREPHRQIAAAGEQRRAAWAATWSAATSHVHPGARVAAVVQRVVDQPRMAPHRHALVRGGEIGLVGDRVLAVRQVVGRIGQQLDQRHADVGGGALVPAGREQAQPVEHQAAKAGVVLRQVVDVGLGRGRAAGTAAWRRSRSRTGTRP